MKKEKRSQVKLAKKAIKDDIKAGLIAELKKLTAIVGHASKKLDKKIEKGAEQLAKKVAKEIKIDKLAVSATTDTKTSKVTAIKKPVAVPAKKSTPAKDAPVPSAS